MTEETIEALASGEPDPLLAPIVEDHHDVLVRLAEIALDNALGSLEVAMVKVNGCRERLEMVRAHREAMNMKINL